MGTCPSGDGCAPVTGSGGDIATVCVPQSGKLCDPCATSKDCEALGLKDSACVQQGALGRFCGVACVAKADCPADYDCQKVTTTEGGLLQQCVRPASNGAAFGVCPCSAPAVQKKLATACYTEVKDASGKVIGQCAGTRACEATGLSACTAPAAQPETCNGKDDDCDGQTDEAACDDTNPCTEDLCDPAKANCAHNNQTGAACEADNNACTVGDACQDGTCVVGKAKDCNDKNVCTLDSCDLAKGCTHSQDDGKPCDADGSLCTQGDVCLAGACKQGTQTGCDDGNPCTIDGCDKKSGQCTAAALDDGVPCDDGTLCTEKDACKLGTCKGKAVVCEDNNPCTADVCDAKAGCKLQKLSGAACEDDNACTVGDVCGEGQCKAGIAKVCSDGNGCTVDTCKAKAGCKYAPGTGACDDGNVCTAGDVCAGGACHGKVVVCDDGDPCTKDACEPGKGCAAVAVAEKTDCAADGGKWCVAGKCLAKAVCGNGKVEPGEQCDDGNNLDGDECAIGCSIEACAPGCLPKKALHPIRPQPLALKYTHYTQAPRTTRTGWTLTVLADCRHQSMIAI